jgi:hypothetical protein
LPVISWNGSQASMPTTFWKSRTIIGHDGGAQQLHARDVGSLLGDVNLAHVNLAFEPKVRGRERDAVVTRAGLGADRRRGVNRPGRPG